MKKLGLTLLLISGSTLAYGLCPSDDDSCVFTRAALEFRNTVNLPAIQSVFPGNCKLDWAGNVLYPGRSAAVDSDAPLELNSIPGIVVSFSDADALRLFAHMANISGSGHYSIAVELDDNGSVGGGAGVEVPICGVPSDEIAHHFDGDILVSPDSFGDDDASGSGDIDGEVIDEDDFSSAGSGDIR